MCLFFVTDPTPQDGAATVQRRVDGDVESGRSEEMKWLIV